METHIKIISAKKKCANKSRNHENHLLFVQRIYHRMG
jgi:hypothetical protein